jgi:hypothetical protein
VDEAGARHLPGAAEAYVESAKLIDYLVAGRDIGVKNE